MLVAIVGTRPEAIKLGPVIRALRAKSLPVTVLGTGQHTSLLAQTHLPIDHSLNIPNDGDPLQFGDRVATALRHWLLENATVGVIVQGDTASAWGGGKGAHQGGVKWIVHVEAGVRSWDDRNPWPEERFRREIDAYADIHFCATEANAQNLRDEFVDDRNLHVVGNPGIDALYQTVQPQVHRQKRVMVTLHRRESHGEPLKQIVAGLCEAARALRDRDFVWPIHPNPNVIQAVGHPPSNVMILPPLDPECFQRMLASSQAVLTDSGGVQEEAAALGIPCVIARDTTDRPESVASGHALLAGRTTQGVTDGILKAVRYGLNSTPSTVFGDGHAADRIATILDGSFAQPHM